MNKEEIDRIAIIGGGITGHAFAWFLTKRSSCEITIFEKQAKSGGLAADIETEYGFKIDQFYHFLYANDSRNTLDFFHALGLHPTVIWNDIRSAVYNEGILFSVDEVKELLKVPILGLKDKLRFLFGMIRTILVNYKKLDKISSRDYLISLFGQKNYDIIWQPLMTSKFSEYADSVPASWIARRIQVTFFSRNLNGKTRYGYIVGTYRPLFKKLKSGLEASGVKFINDQVIGITQNATQVDIELAIGGKQHFDKVVVATPISVAKKIIRHPEIVNKIQRFNDLDAYVVMLFLKKRFSDHFWINVNDSGIPFTGIIELTNLTGTAPFNGINVLYLVQYLSDKSQFDKDSALANVSKYLSKINPQFNPKDIIKQFDSFAPGAAPIPFLNYMSEMPTHRTNQSRIFLLNSSMIYPQDRGVGNSIKLAERHIDEFIKS